MILGEVIDIHVHFGAPENSENGCYWSKQFERTPAYLYLKLSNGVLLDKLTFHLIKNNLISTITHSKKVDKCVLLAMDEVYALNGHLKKEETHLHTPNSFIVELSKKYDRILFGASVHPYRNDWQKELDYCIKNGAVLCKWIPSSQQIDVANDKCFPFYDYLAAHNLPLLVHSGPEYSIPTSNKWYTEINNPKYLRAALERGVTVIAAHCALPYFGDFDTDYQDDMFEFFMLMEEAVNKNWKLYADVSALAAPLRNSYIPRIKNQIPPDRLIYASDYPVFPSELSYKDEKNIFNWISLTFKAFSIKNPLDKNYFAIKKMGFDEKVFTNSSELFGKIIRN
jgi:predicted TIM-barrel fold metal-dependent hydrolase